MLPFGIRRERKPKNYEKQQLKKQGITKQDLLGRKLATTNLGAFYVDPQIEIEPWKPKQKLMEITDNWVEYKPTIFTFWHDPSERKEMYFEQDLMAKSISMNIDKKSGFKYRLKPDKNVVIRKSIVMVSEKTLIKMAHEFVEECNRILYLYCDVC